MPNPITVLWNMIEWSREGADVFKLTEPDIHIMLEAIQGSRALVDASVAQQETQVLRVKIRVSRTRTLFLRCSPRLFLKRRTLRNFSSGFCLRDSHPRACRVCFFLHVVQMNWDTFLFSVIGGGISEEWQQYDQSFCDSLMIWVEGRDAQKVALSAQTAFCLGRTVCQFSETAT